jgi:hypothetical protein
MTTTEEPPGPRQSRLSRWLRGLALPDAGPTAAGQAGPAAPANAPVAGARAEWPLAGTAPVADAPPVADAGTPQDGTAPQDRTAPQGATPLPEEPDVPRPESAAPAEGDGAAPSPEHVGSQDAAAPEEPTDVPRPADFDSSRDEAGPADTTDRPGPEEIQNALAGKVMSEQEAARLGRRAEQAELARPTLPRIAQPIERQQIYEFVELARRLRVPSLAGHLAIGAGEWISTAAARATASKIATYVVSAVAADQVPVDGQETAANYDQAAADDEPGNELEVVPDQEQLEYQDRIEELLMRPLVVPRKQTDAEDMQFTLPIVNANGGISLDVSTTADGAESPQASLVRVNEQLEMQAPQASDIEPKGAAATAAVIWGSAAAIAEGRPYLSVDALMSYARKEAFGEVYKGTPESAAQGMRAARNLEVVVLLDRALGGGLWIDVDPDTGRPAAALAIEILSTMGPDGIRVTRLAGI